MEALLRIFTIHTCVFVCVYVCLACVRQPFAAGRGETLTSRLRHMTDPLTTINVSRKSAALVERAWWKGDDKRPRVTPISITSAQFHYSRGGVLTHCETSSLFIWALCDREDTRIRGDTNDAVVRSCQL